MTTTTMPTPAHNGQNGKIESSLFNHQGESSTLVLSADSDDAPDGLLTLVEIARRIEADDSKHAAVLAKIKRLVAHESVRELLYAQRAGGKGFRYPESAVEKMHYLVTNPLVSAANADEYLRTLDIAPKPTALAKTTGSSLFDMGGESSMSALSRAAEIIGAAIQQSSESSISVLLPFMERITSALEAQAASVQAEDRAVPKAEAAQIMGVAELSVNRHIPALTSGHVSYLHIQEWLAARRAAAEQRRANGKQAKEMNKPRQLQ